MYASGSAAYKLVALAMLPLIARGLSPAELGILDLSAVLGAFVGVLVGVGIENAVANALARGERPALVWSSSLAILGLVAGVVIGVAWLSADLASPALSPNFERDTWVASAVYGTTLAFAACGLNAIRVRGNRGLYAVAAFVLLLSELAATVILVFVFSAPVTVIVLAWAGTTALGSTVIFVRYLPHLSMPRLSVVRSLVALGLPVVPGLGLWIIGDVVIRSAVADADPSLLGSYSLAHRAVAPMALVVSGIVIAWPPYLFRQPSETSHARTTWAAAVCISLLLCLAILLSAAAPIVVAILGGDEYARGAQAVGPLATAQAAMALIAVLSGLAFASSRTASIAWAAAFGTSVQILVAQTIGSPDTAVFMAGIASATGFGAAAIILAIQLRVNRGFWLRGAVPLAVVGLIAASINRSLPGLPIVERVGLSVAVIVGLLLLLFQVTRVNVRGGVPAP